ncbi:DUF402 domain-containing protein [Gorillibacterium timonense]|uniref:DUF402 domain-containing protein n=1 Tax=Gorillibacterium timonense TaxID=1689269 RepID=UPI001F28C3D3|nr:DUF402 domain-containing protein [Gorillibacterium timonense]
MTYTDQRFCIADQGYYWLQHFPTNLHHSMTTMFDDEGQIVQHYIDICYRNGVSTENIPWMDDLYLDIIVLPSGTVIQKDAEELEQALLDGSIDKGLYHLAKDEAEKLFIQIEQGNFPLLKLAEEHKDLLMQDLKR